ncbi:MAG: hypothetical protein Q9223_000137 [Gallowayella weberi]
MLALTSGFVLYVLIYTVLPTIATASQDFVSKFDDLPRFGQLQKLLGQAPRDSNITTKYPGLTTKYYRLRSLYVACSISSLANLPPVAGNSPPPVTIPQPCQVQFTGVNSRGKAISQRCPYSGTSLNPDLQPCSFDGDDFADVITLHVDVADALTLPNTTSVYLDDITHTNYY